MKHYLIHYTKKGPSYPFYGQHIYATEGTLEIVARAIVMGQYNTTENTKCNVFDYDIHESRTLWSW